MEGSLGPSRGAERIVRGRLNRGLFKAEAVAFVASLLCKLLDFRKHKPEGERNVSTYFIGPTKINLNRQSPIEFS